MTIEAHIENGQVVLPSPLNLPDGTRVKVEPVSPNGSEVQAIVPSAPALRERMKSVIGIAEGLPPDAARQVDHYLYGHPNQ